MRIKTAISFSSHFGIAPDNLTSTGIIDPFLNIDAKLFIDPMLLQVSVHPEMRAAHQSYKDYHTKIFKLLLASKHKGDVAWRNAERLFSGKEIRGTSLGYGNSGISGSSLDAQVCERLLLTAKEIVELGVDDPDLFAALALFEEGVGPDYIGDLTTAAIIAELIQFNSRIYSALEIKLEEFHLGGYVGYFPPNPLQNKRTPVILVPRDVVRDLPIASDWDGVSDAAAWNEELRTRINRHLGEIISKSAKEKPLIREAVLRDRESFRTLLSMIGSATKVPYNFEKDPNGEYILREINGRLQGEMSPPKLELPESPSLEDIHGVTITICSNFKRLVENNGFANDLWIEPNERPAPEKKAQRLFFAIADTYCRANNLDLSPESDSGVGPVDFKLSNGYQRRVLVEVKLTSNSHVVSGYEKQLEAYKDAEQTVKAVYLVIDVGKVGNKLKTIEKIRRERVAQGLPVSEIIVVDGAAKLSASKRT